MTSLDSESMDTGEPSDSAFETESPMSTDSETDPPQDADTDPCSLGTHDCSPLARCLPLANGYECRCDEGFEGDGKTCSDVNECLQDAVPCEEDATCHNTEGGYECLCELGYTPDGISGCLAEPGSCAMDPFGYCLPIEIRLAQVLDRHISVGAETTLRAEVHHRARASDIAAVTVDLSPLGEATATPMAPRGTLDGQTGIYEQSIDTSGLASGLYDLEVTATSISGARHTKVARLLVYTGAVREVGSSFGTIQAAIDAADDGDLVLVPEGTFSGPGNTELHTDGKAIVLDSVSGPENSIIDLQGMGSGFHFFSSGETSSTVIAGLAIRNASSSAIRLEATPTGLSVKPTLFNLRLESNTSQEQGGALQIVGSGAGARILDAVFDGNGWLSQTGEGGAMYVSANAYALIEDCSFTGNQAGYGGAITGDTGGHLELLRSTFNGNQSSQKGGALWADSAQLERCDFSGNATAYEGGAAYIYSAATFEDCSFEGNSSAGSSSAGGAIYARGSLEVRASGLRRNDAQHYAGGIYSSGALFLSDSVALYNTATDSGGAVMMRAGGGILGSLFHGNAVTTTNTSYGNGGAVYIDAPASSPAQVTDCVFSSNFSSRSGGAIRGSSVTVTGSIFRHNTAGAYGGAVYLWSKDNVIRGSHMQANRAALHGGAIYISRDSSPTLLIEDSAFVGNTALGSGGAINAYRTQNLTARHCLFLNNEASFTTGLGGAVRCYEVVEGCRFESCVLRGNRANYGGALRTKDASLSLWNVLVDHNTARTSGGGLHINNLIPADVTVESSTFSHNGSLIRGGGLYLFNGVLSLRDSIVFFNQAVSSAELHVYSAPANAVSISYCDIQEGGITDAGSSINQGEGFVPGVLGNLSGDPLFADPSALDFSLLETSPCLDAGSRTAAAAGLDHLSARSDEVLDSGILDLGYHDADFPH
jgi:predicted outer membrane repeat protein